MSTEKDCEWCFHINKSAMAEPCRSCGIAMLNFEPRKPITNYHRLISKTPEEMAEWLAKHNERSAVCPNFGAHGCQASCKQCWLDWLKEEATE